MLLLETSAASSSAIATLRASPADSHTAVPRSAILLRPPTWSSTPSAPWLVLTPTLPCLPVMVRCITLLALRSGRGGSIASARSHDDLRPYSSSSIAEGLVDVVPVIQHTRWPVVRQPRMRRDQRPRRLSVSGADGPAALRPRHEGAGPEARQRRHLTAGTPGVPASLRSPRLAGWAGFAARAAQSSHLGARVAARGRTRAGPGSAG